MKFLQTLFRDNFGTFLKWTLVILLAGVIAFGDARWLRRDEIDTQVERQITKTVPDIIHLPSRVEKIEAEIETRKRVAESYNLRIANIEAWISEHKNYTADTVRRMEQYKTSFDEVRAQVAVTQALVQEQKQTLERILAEIRELRKDGK